MNIHLRKYSDALLYTLLFLVINSFIPKIEASTPYTQRNWKPLATKLTANKRTNRDKAYAIYRWLCDNIAYDTDYKIFHADEAFEKRKGVCNAYAEIFILLGEAVGLKVEKINGDTKTGSHAWNVIYLENGKPLLVDATWGAGGVNGKTFLRNYKYDGWFDVEPEMMIFNHLPEQADKQFLSTPLTKAQFQLLPDLSPDVKKIGISPREILYKGLNGLQVDIPQFFRKFSGLIKLINIPKSGVLRKGQTYEVVIGRTDPKNVAIVNESDWYTDWIVDNHTMKLRFTPKLTGKLDIDVRVGNVYYQVVHYTVK